MKKHALAAFGLIILFFTTKLIVGEFEPSLTPVWLTPVLLCWVGSIAKMVDNEKSFAAIMVLTFYIAMVAVLGAAAINALKLPPLQPGEIYMVYFFVSMLMLSTVAATRVFGNNEIFGKSELFSHSVSLSQFALTITVLTWI